MSWSYSGNPADSKLDEIRFLLGDTTEDSTSLSDEEIIYILAQNSDVVRASAADAAERTAGRFLKKSIASKKVGDLTLEYEYSESYNRYMALGKLLRSASTDAPAINMKAPLISDVSEPIFYIGMGDNFRGI